MNFTWIMTGLQPPKVPHAVFMVEIENSGAPSSVLMSGWEFTVIKKDGTREVGQPAQLGSSEEDFCLDGGKKAMRFVPADMLPIRASSVIQHNGSTSGILTITFPHGRVTLDDLRNPATQIEISIKAATGQVFSSRVSLGQIQSSGYAPDIKYPVPILSSKCR